MDKQVIKDFYKNAGLNDIPKDVVRAFEFAVREDENKEVKEKLDKILKIFEDDSLYYGTIIKFEIENRLNL